MPGPRETHGHPTTWQHVVAIGGSAGAISALQILCAGLPASFPAPILVTVHIPSTAPSVLPRILDRSGILPVSTAHDGDALRAGEVYVAPPGMHLTVSPDGRAQLDPGPRENGHRPAIDPLFRSVAATAGRHAAAVVLSGSGDDGTDGARAVSEAGGTVIVQDPSEAAHASMPREAVRRDHPHEILRVADIPRALTEFVNDQDGQPVPIGARSAQSTSIFSAIHNDLEPAIWAAVRLFEQHAAQCDNLARRSTGSGRSLSTLFFESRAAEARERASVLRQALRNRHMSIDVLRARAGGAT